MHRSNDFLTYDAVNIIEDNQLTIILNMSAGHCE